MSSDLLRAWLSAMSEDVRLDHCVWREREREREGLQTMIILNILDLSRFKKENTFFTHHHLLLHHQETGSFLHSHSAPNTRVWSVHNQQITITFPIQSENRTNLGKSGQPGETPSPLPYTPYTNSSN